MLQNFLDNDGQLLQMLCSLVITSSTMDWNLKTSRISREPPCYSHCFLSSTFDFKIYMHTQTHTPLQLLSLMAYFIIMKLHLLVVKFKQYTAYRAKHEVLYSHSTLFNSPLFRNSLTQNFLDICMCM